MREQKKSGKFHFVEGSPDSCHPFLCRSLYQFDFLHPISNKRQKFPHNVFPRRHASQRDIWRNRHNYVWKLNRFLFPVVIPVSSVCSNLSGFDISFKKEIPQGKCWKSLKTAIKKFERAVKEGNKEEASNNLNVAIQKIDKAMSTGLVHKNKAARLKSRLTKMNNNIK